MNERKIVIYYDSSKLWGFVLSVALSILGAMIALILIQMFFGERP